MDISKRGAEDWNDEESEREKKTGGGMGRFVNVIPVQTIVYIAQILSPISRFLISVEIIALQWHYINSDHDILDNRQTCFENEKKLLIFFRY